MKSRILRTILVTLIFSLALVVEGLLATETAKEKSLKENECGAVVTVDGISIKGQVQIAKPIYQKGDLWTKPVMPEGLLKWLNERTKISLRVLPEKFQISSEQLFKQPFLLISGDSEFAFSKKEEANLQKYLIEKGGFLFITYAGEDSPVSKTFDNSVRALLKRVLSKHSLEPLSPQHEIYTNYYAMGAPPKGVSLEGISIEKRLAVLYSPANYWSALSDPKQEDMGKLRFATNVVIYALTHGKISDYSGLKPK